MMQPKTEHQTRKQVINATAFVVSVTATYLANALMNVDLSQITEDYSLTISPAGWAFSIWGLIYSLITVFVVYQALTDKCATSRNNELIYNNINYWFAANFAIGSIWVFMF
jgi:translocator protein